MDTNTPYQRLPRGTAVSQTVVIPPRASSWNNNTSTFAKLFIIGVVTIMALMALSGGITIIVQGVFPLASIPFIIIGCFLLFVAFGLCCLSCFSSSDGVGGPGQGATQTVGGPVVGQVVNYPTTPAASGVPGGLVSTYTYTPPNQPSPAQATGQVVTYPTTPAAPGVPGGLVSTYTYSPPNQPSPAQGPAPTYPYPAGGQAPNYPSPGQVPAPAYPYAGGHVPAYPMDHKPPIGAPVEASAPGFQAPPTAPSPYLSEYQAPPPYAPSEEPPPYSK